MIAVVNPDQETHRAIGQRLADFVRAQGEQLPPPAVLQGVVSDLAAGEVDLVLPLKHLIAMPGFRAVACKAGSGSGALERDALLQSLGDLFSTRISGALTEVLTGFLDLPDSPGAHSDEPVLAPDLEPPPRAPSVSQRQHEEVAPSAQASTSTTPTPIDRFSGRAWLLMGLAAWGVAIGAGVIVITRVTPICVAVKACPDQLKLLNGEAVKLAAASDAQKALQKASDLRSYQQAADQLDSALSTINNLELSSEQQHVHKRLQAIASDAREVIAEEKLDQERLLRAEQAIESARTLSGEGRKAQLDAASRDLQSISTSGFAGVNARELRQQLATLEVAAAASPSPAAREQGVIIGSPSTETHSQASAHIPKSTWTPPARSSTYPPRPYSHSPSGDGGGPPLRSQPLW